ncbi:MAG: RNA polymerase sigma factor [Clostridia bacterium]
MEEIYKEYSKYVFNYLLSFTNNVEIAEELMQETFYSAIKNIHKFQNNSSLKTWLYKIAKNKWLDYYKTTKKIQETDIDEISEKFLLINSFEEDYANKDELIDVYKKIHMLDEKSKEVIYLRIKCEFNFKEIGNIMGKTEEWARITFYRAKIKLKEDFENE